MSARQLSQVATSGLTKTAPMVPLAVCRESRLAVRKAVLCSGGRDPRKQRQVVFERVGKGGQSLIGSPPLP